MCPPKDVEKLRNHYIFFLRNLTWKILECTRRRSSGPSVPVERIYTPALCVLTSNMVNTSRVLHYVTSPLLPAQPPAMGSESDLDYCLFSLSLSLLLSPAYLTSLPAASIRFLRPAAYGAETNEHTDRSRPAHCYTNGGE